MQNNIHKLSLKNNTKTVQYLYGSICSKRGKFFERAPFTVLSSLIQAGNTIGKGGGTKTWHLILNYDTISL